MPDRSRLHLGVVIQNLHTGGAEFVCRQWIAELTRRGHQVTVYLYDRHQPVVSVPDGVSVRTFRPRWMPMRRLMLPIWLRRTILDTSPDVVLAMLTYSNFATLLASRLGRGSFPPVAISERNVASLLIAPGRWRDRLVLWLAGRLYRRADAGVAISHPVAVDMLTTFKMPPERVFVVPNPVIRSEEVEPSRPSGAAVRDDPLHVVFVGRLVAQKRPELFLEVVEQLASQGMSVRATIVGDGPLRASLERSVSDGRLPVSFAGWQEPWWEAAGDIDCLVLTSRVEGFANVLVEAARAGIPCVAGGRALGVADAIIPGVTGEFAMPDRAADYAAAVLRAVRQQLTDSPPVQAWLAHFSVQNSADCLLRALDYVSSARHC